MPSTPSGSAGKTGGEPWSLPDADSDANGAGTVGVTTAQLADGAWALDPNTPASFLGIKNAPGRNADNAVGFGVAGAGLTAGLSAAGFVDDTTALFSPGQTASQRVQDGLGMGGNAASTAGAVASIAKIAGADVGSKLVPGLGIAASAAALASDYISFSQDTGHDKTLDGVSMAGDVLSGIGAGISTACPVLGLAVGITGSAISLAANVLKHFW
jgi:hypothetical protein